MATSRRRAVTRKTHAGTGLQVVDATVEQDGGVILKRVVLIVGCGGIRVDIGFYDDGVATPGNVRREQGTQGDFCAANVGCDAGVGTHQLQRKTVATVYSEASQCEAVGKGKLEVVIRAQRLARQGNSS